LAGRTGGRDREGVHVQYSRLAALVGVVQVDGDQAIAVGTVKVVKTAPGRNTADDLGVAVAHVLVLKGDGAAGRGAGGR
jgi:hypothetical protein